MAQQQAQVDEVVGIMRNNVEKVLERDQKLNELDEKADALQAMKETGFLGLGKFDLKPNQIRIRYKTIELGGDINENG